MFYSLFLGNSEKDNEPCGCVHDDWKWENCKCTDNRSYICEERNSTFKTKTINDSIFQNLIIRRISFADVFCRCCFWDSTECPAGQYKTSAFTCEPCTGNTVKSVADGNNHCNTEPPCDGISLVPNARHTRCGK